MLLLQLTAAGIWQAAGFCLLLAVEAADVAAATSAAATTAVSPWLKQ